MTQPQMITRSSQKNGLNSKKLINSKSAGGQLNKGKTRPKNKDKKKTDDSNDKSAIHAAHGEFIARYKGTATYDSFSETNWYEKHEVLFKVDWEQWNFIHRAIKELKGRLPGQILHVIKRMVLEQPESFTALDTDKKSPLFYAAKHNIDILFSIIEILIPESLISKINIRCSNDTEGCPLMQISDERKEQCLNDRNASRELKDKLTDIIANAKQDNGNPGFCLHGKIDVEKLKVENEKLRTALKTALDSPEQPAYTFLEKILIPARFDKADYAAIDDTPAEDTEVEESETDSTQFDHAEVNSTEIDNAEFEGTEVDGTEVDGTEVDGEVDDEQVDETEGANTVWTKQIKTFLQLCPDSVFTYAPPGKLTPLQMAINLYNEQDLDYSLLFEIVQLLIERAPWSIFTNTEYAGNKTTAYKLVKSVKSPDNSQIYAIKQAVELLKRTCIGYQGKVWDAEKYLLASQITSEEKRSYLYSEVENEKQFCFNLEGEYATIDRAYINIMKNHSRLEFESVLEFVRLPYWKQQNPQDKEKLHQDGTEKKDFEPDPYIDLFRYIWDNGTTKIFTLEVDDDGPEPHTNAAIREALQGKDLKPHVSQEEVSGSSPPLKFDIETWKWKKIDICTDTVATAAPTARNVWLWSSGNTAVLRGWACSSGLDRMEKLESLTVVVNPKNPKDSADCNNYLETFKLDVSERCRQLSPENIKIKISPLYRTKHQLSDEGAMQSGNHNSSAYKTTNKPGEWIQELYYFKQYILNLARKSGLQVKVAVIDDGCRLVDLEGTKPTGRSFCADDRFYFAGRCEHGTSMARCIRDVCPTASLYIARLDVSQKEENQTFTVKSCCQALRWAIAVGVDVISMSWTFPIKKPDEDPYGDEFHQLIIEAEKKNIILFGSLPDRGPTARLSDFAPVGLAEVIRIGSATVYGEGAPENSFAEADFLFPGEESKDGDEIIKGSSYATAYASGLAAAVLLTIKLLGQYSSDEAQRAEKNARTKKGMEDIFRRMSLGDAANQKTNIYVRPYQIVGRKAEDFDDFEDGKQDTLGKIVQKFFYGK